MERFEWHRLDTAVLKVFSSTLSATCSCIRQHEERYHQLTPESCRRSFPLLPNSREKILSVALLQLHVGALVKQRSSALFPLSPPGPNTIPECVTRASCFIYIIRGCPITKEHALLMAHLELSIASGRRSRSPSLIIWLSHLL